MSGKRATRRAERHREILDTALTVLVQDGPQGLTMPGLADRLGCAVGGLYRYFPGKDALLAELQREALGAFRQDLEEALKRAAADAEGMSEAGGWLHRLARAGWVYLQDAGREPTRHKLLAALVANPDPVLTPDRVERAEEPLQQVLSRVARLFDEAVAARALVPGDSAQRTHVLWATVHGLDHMRKRDRRTPARLKTAALALEALGALLRGWGGAEAAVEEGLGGLPRLR